MRAREFIVETLTPQHIHDLADKLGIPWDDDPDFLRMTKQVTGKAHLDDLDQTGLRKIRDHLKRKTLKEGGWDTKITQGTVIRPSTVKKVLAIMATFVDEFNAFLAARNMAPIKLGYPTGSSAYHEVDPEDNIYGDIDLQIIVPDLPELADKTTAQVQGFWHKLMDEFVKTQRPVYVHLESEPGHPIVQVDSDAWVQVDLMPHPTPLATWGRFRVTPERGVKGLLNGNMFSVLGELLMMSIQHAGVQFKQRDGKKLPYTKTRKDYELVTLTTNIENFVKDIFDHEYEQITGKDPRTARIDPLLIKHPGSDLREVKISNLANAIKGLARSFEANDMYGKGDLSPYSGADDFLARFWEIYEAKAMKDIMASKRDKAETPEAKARAESDKTKVTKGLEMVRKLFK
jgi:hypothetical protein